MKTYNEFLFKGGKRRGSGLTPEPVSLNKTTSLVLGILIIFGIFGGIMTKCSGYVNSKGERAAKKAISAWYKERGNKVEAFEFITVKYAPVEDLSAEDAILLKTNEVIKETLKTFRGIGLLQIEQLYENFSALRERIVEQKADSSLIKATDAILSFLEAGKTQSPQEFDKSVGAEIVRLEKVDEKMKLPDGETYYFRVRLDDGASKVVYAIRADEKAPFQVHEMSVDLTPSEELDSSEPE